MEYKKTLTIQDISCVGQCSLTVALPILSACAMETCILPSAVLSTHGKFMQGYAVFDAAKIAADYTVKCIENIQDDKDYWNGVKFETALSELMK